MANQFSRIALAGLGLLLAIGAGVASCNNHPADYRAAGGAVEHLTTVSAGAGGKLDILWVIDSSGSMCEEQEDLRTSFVEFIKKLDEETTVDFNIGVTTTNMKPVGGNDRDPVARAGHLQSTPHPPVGNFDACEEPEALRKQINAAVDCTKNPDDFKELRDPSDQLIECALKDTNCPADKNPEEFKRFHLFPCAHKNGSKCATRMEFEEIYRQPKGDDKLIRASDYRNPDRSLQTDQLKQDFKCMSYVGTRGSTFEAGIRAAAEALSPAKTGGPVGNAYENGTEVRDRLKDRVTDDGEAMTETKGKEAPNHGLVRPGAKTAVLFVTDENDCSSPNEQANIGERCAQLYCYFPQSDAWSEEQWSGGTKPLLDEIPALAETLRKNLADSKRTDELESTDLIVGSIHGNYKKYGSKSGQTIPSGGPTCTGNKYENLVSTLNVCNNPRGTAKSGDRYADFLEKLREAGFETIPGESRPRKGFMCNDESLQGPLEAIAAKFRPGGGNCVTNRVLPCRMGSDNPDCPDYQFAPQSGAGKLCKQWGKTSGDNKNGDKNGFCASAVRLQIEPRSDDSSFDEDLSDERDRFCIQSENPDEDSVGVNGPNTCVMKPSFYSWEPCDGNPNAIQVAWNDSKFSDRKEALRPLIIKARYTEVVESDLEGGEGGDQSGGDDQQN